MLITELFNAPTQWKWQSANNDVWNATFMIGNISYECYLTPSPSDDVYSNPEAIANLWYTEFAAHVPHPVGKQNDAYGIIGTGNSVLVFSTIVSILKDFKKHHPKAMLEFSADDPSRKKLYRALAKKLSNGYTITRIENLEIYRVV